MAISLRFPSLARHAYQRVAEREGSRLLDLEMLTWTYELGQMGQRVLVNDLYKAGLDKRHKLYKAARRLIAAGWLERTGTASAGKSTPTLVVTVAGLLLIERIRRELRTCGEMLTGAGRGKIRRTYTKKKENNKTDKQSVMK
ncbi:hypothetical protein [Hymenobacter glacieicola]|uniref:HTH marR-type domain-containing protein n=1 Tax=Hymenobacter glacieicola TaxID=1562124 RepID=A0ABQ1X8K0_9BACT|nr:hypothetical protein [Hymenobacter glacieicola]GGG61061.1 hypothetical protein GCM10011378_41340 [Hymenobacter glacieicola]